MICIFEWSKQPKMRFLAVFWSLVCWIDLILHITIVLNEFQNVTKMHYWMIQRAKKEVFGRFLDFILLDRLDIKFRSQTTTPENRSSCKSLDIPIMMSKNSHKCQNKAVLHFWMPYDREPRLRIYRWALKLYSFIYTTSLWKPDVQHHSGSQENWL